MKAEIVSQDKWNLWVAWEKKDVGFGQLVMRWNEKEQVFTIDSELMSVDIVMEIFKALTNTCLTTSKPYCKPNELTDCDCEWNRFETLKRSRDELNVKIENLKTVMIAAAEEIATHWGAHCDVDGYGPSNLMHRLQQGIPSHYSYTAGDFAKQQTLLKEVDDLLASLEDSAHGQEGKRITEMRGKIQKV